MDLTVGGNNNMLLRDHRKGNWNLQETMVLIQAKRMDDERRSRRSGEAADRVKPAELRWKWVEDYCWQNGCLRSQNQCNDKWDNLMRDFKKVREYENKITAPERAGAGGGISNKSYWRIDKSERKDNNLPSNMLPQIFEALMEVVERRGQRPLTAGGGGGEHAFMTPTPVVLVGPSSAADISFGAAVPATSQPLPTADSDTSEYSGSRAKRRKRRGVGGVEGTSGGATVQELGSAISKSASTIAEAIQSSGEREERRHREVLCVHERRLQIEESKGDQMNRGEANGLVDAINNLANSIFALAAHNNNNHPSSPSK